MAIAFDKSSSSNSAGASTSLNLAAAASGELAVLFIQGTTGDTHSNVTVNGVAATQVGSTYQWSDRSISAWYFQNPPTSSVAYAATTSTADGIILFVHLYSGAGIPNALNTADNPASSSLTLSVTVPSANSWIASTYITTGSGTNSNAAGTGTQLRQTIGSASSGDSNDVVGTGSQSMGWTGGRTKSGGIIIAIPLPGTATAVSPTAGFMSLLGVGN